MAIGSKSQSGFTIIELIMVIVIIGILAAIAILSFGTWRESLSKNQLKSDLQTLASEMEKSRNFNNVYPTTIPSDFVPTSGTVVQFATADANEFCANARHLSSLNILASYDSKTKKIREAPCVGVPTGTAVGGTMPALPDNSNLVLDFSNWTFAGGASYDASTQELSIGAAGTATSPLVYVNRPTSLYMGGDFYATTASPNGSIAPQGAYLMTARYYAVDGVTTALNSSGVNSNGCAKVLSLNTWSTKDTRCVFAAGPNVYYAKYILSGGGGYASPDLKIKNPLVTIVK